MRPPRVIAGAALLLALAACGQSATTGATGEAPASATSPAPPSGGSVTLEPGLPTKIPPYPTGVLPPSVDPTAPPTDAVLLPASQVDTSGLPASYSDHNVYDVAVYSLNGGRSLRITASASDACIRLQARVADQTQDTVRVNISPLATPQGGPADGPGGGGMCAQVLTPQTFTVDLKVPLGTRKVFLAEAP